MKLTETEIKEIRKNAIAVLDVAQLCKSIKYLEN